MAKKFSKQTRSKYYFTRERASKIIGLTLGILYIFLITYVAAPTFLVQPRSAMLDGEIYKARALFLFVFITILFYIINLFPEITIRLTVANDGIWYKRFWRETYIPWEQIEAVRVIKSPIFGNKIYGFVIKQTPGGRNPDYRFIPLSMFVEEWFVSELREHIHKLCPTLPMQ
jgi:hypothetical protein